MAISGNGQEYDITFLAGANIRTTTAQYLAVALVPGTTTADRTVEGCNLTGTYATPTIASDFAVGINQSYMSSGSQECAVRLFGVSKAKCAASITAGAPVRAFNGGSITMAGYIQMIPNGVSILAATASVSAQFYILGRALESGSTNTVISIMIQPQLYDKSLMTS